MLNRLDANDFKTPSNAAIPIPRHVSVPEGSEMTLSAKGDIA
jgi:hypothetical protein